MRYYTSAEKAPKKYQLMIVFEDDSFLAFTVSMYGPSTLSKASLTIPITKVASISYVRWTRDSIKPILSVSSGISRKIYPQRRYSPPSNVFRAWATESAKISCSMPGSPPKRKNIDFIRRGYRPPLQHREIHAGRDDSPRRPGYGEGSIRRLRQLPHDPIEEHLPWPLPRLWQTDTEEAYLGGSIYYCPHCQRER